MSSHDIFSFDYDYIENWKTQGWWFINAACRQTTFGSQINTPFGKMITFTKNIFLFIAPYPT